MDVTCGEVEAALCSMKTRNDLRLNRVLANEFEPGRTARENILFNLISWVTEDNNGMEEFQNTAES